MGVVYKLNGREVTREVFRRNRRGLRGGAAAVIGGRGWPLHSDAAGVHPSQRQQAMEHARQIGVPTEFDAAGRAVFRSRQHRKAYCEKVGLYDRDGGYGDPQRRA